MDRDKRLEIAIKYAWDWFGYHARQRLAAFQFFLVIVGIILAGYAGAVQQGIKEGWFVASIGAFISLAFLILDIRNTELVNCGRAALDQLEREVRVNIRRDDQKRIFFYQALGWLGRGLYLGLRVIFGRFGAGRETFNRVVALPLTHQAWLRIIELAALGLFIWLSFRTDYVIGLVKADGRGEVTVGRMESLMAQAVVVERKLGDLILVRSVAGRGSPDVVIRGQIGAFLVLSGDLMRSCKRPGAIERFCADYEKWYLEAAGVFERVRIAKCCKIAEALKEVPEATLGELEYRLRGSVGQLGKR